MDVKETVITGGSTDTIPLLKRAFMFLEDGDWQRADEYCEKVLDIKPECAEAYLGKLMAELQVRKQEGLKDCKEPFDEKNNYQKIIRFGDDSLVNTLLDYLDYINVRNENIRLKGIYSKAKNAMDSAKSEGTYKEAAKLFNSIGEYKDSTSLAKRCLESAEVARKDAALSEAEAKMAGDQISNYEEAIKLFESISGWCSVDEKINLCQQKIEELKIKAEEKRLEREMQEEAARKNKEQLNRKVKIIAKIAIPAIIIVVVFIGLLNAVIIPNAKYNEAVSLMEVGKYEEAIVAFEELDGYKDSEEKKESIYEKYELQKLKTAKVGDIVSFGNYEQDGKSPNGKEVIKWLVLAKEGNRILVISEYALHCKQYNPTNKDVTWEICMLRTWLNNDFLNSAFTDGEKAMIPTVTVSADKNPEYDTDPGNATQDKVFLLSIDEVNRYFSSDSARICQPTRYTIQNWDVIHNNGNCNWWLRSPGAYQNYAAFVNSSGSVSDHGLSIGMNFNVVRPALWIDLKF